VEGISQMPQDMGFGCAGIPQEHVAAMDQGKSRVNSGLPGFTLLHSQTR